ncbi:MAG: DinB family protein [Longimicrobiales bacterium]
MSNVEVWLRGPVPGVPTELMPVAHSLLQAREELEPLVAPIGKTRLWVKPGGAASIGFHVLHLTGSTDRLFTYARGDSLTDGQRAQLAVEKEGGDPSRSAADVLADFGAAIDGFLRQLRGWDPTTLDDFRGVGAKALPSNVRGLLFHAAEHAQRHVGQVKTTLVIQNGM